MGRYDPNITDVPLAVVNVTYGAKSVISSISTVNHRAQTQTYCLALSDTVSVLYRSLVTQASTSA